MYLASSCSISEYHFIWPEHFTAREKDRKSGSRCNKINFLFYWRQVVTLGWIGKKLEEISRKLLNSEMPSRDRSKNFYIASKLIIKRKKNKVITIMFILMRVLLTVDQIYLCFELIIIWNWRINHKFKIKIIINLHMFLI